MTVYGDNPNFDPVRFAELRSGRTDSVVQQPEAESAAPIPEPTPAEVFRPPFVTPPAYGWDAAGGAVLNVPPLPEPPRAFPAPEPAGPVAALTMRDISDHFERDARRY